MITKKEQEYERNEEVIPESNTKKGCLQVPKNIKIFCLACASAYQAQKDSTMARQVKAAYRTSPVCLQLKGRDDANT